MAAGLKSELGTGAILVLCDQKPAVEVVLQWGINVSTVFFKRREPFLTLCPFQSLYVFVSLTWAFKEEFYTSISVGIRRCWVCLSIYLSGTGYLLSSPSGACSLGLLGTSSVGEPGTGRPERATCQLWDLSGQLTGPFGYKSSWYGRWRWKCTRKALAQRGISGIIETLLFVVGAAIWMCRGTAPNSYPKFKYYLLFFFFYHIIHVASIHLIFFWNSSFNHVLPVFVVETSSFWFKPLWNIVSFYLSESL